MTMRAEQWFPLWIEGGTVVQWLELLPDNKKVVGSIPSLLEIGVFLLCLHGFSQVLQLPPADMHGNARRVWKWMNTVIMLHIHCQSKLWTHLLVQYTFFYLYNFLHSN